MFTCPPYNDKENWDEAIKNYTCDEWIGICMTNFTCKEYIFVIDTTEKYKDYIVETLTNKSHFSKNTELIIKINK